MVIPVALVLLMLASAGAKAQLTDFTYYIDTYSKEATIEKYTGSGGDVVIPGAINGYPVKTIGYGAFSDCAGVSSVSIPNSVITIESDAFSSCSGLRSVTIPDSVTSIGYYAFDSCTGLGTVTIGDGVTDIGGSAFAHCSGIYSLNLGKRVASIGGSAFSDCSGLAGIILPDSLTSIGDRAFSDCQGISSITIPGKVATIGNGAFDSSNGLTHVTVSEGVTNIGYGAFKNCSALANIDLPSSITSIGDLAFYSCASLQAITIPQKVTSIGDYAFSDCRSLAGIVIPNSVTSIGSSAFSSCDGLTTVVIGNGVTSIRDYAFSSCAKLTSVTIGKQVTSIGDSAFSSCSELASVIIPPKVTSIGGWAFCYTKLGQVFFLGNPPSLGSNGFYSYNSSTYQSWYPTIFYLPNASGWGTAFGDCTTALWTAPAVVNLNPSHASIGARVVIAGANLANVSGVKFGTVSASFTVDSSSQITAVVPAGTPGQQVDVKVFTPSLSAANAATDDFIYDIPAPNITGISPDHGPVTGSTSVIITGSFFTGATTVSFGSTPALSFRVDSDTQITALSPAGTPGQIASISVSTARGTSADTWADDFLYDYPQPTITRITPAHGGAAGGVTVTISGSGFIEASAVYFGETPARSYQVVSATQITAVSPPGSFGQVIDISVETPGGTSANTQSDNFSYDYPAPAITGITPARGSAAGGTIVSITGSNFAAVSSVKIGSTPAASYQVNSLESITALTPAGTAGQIANVTVTTLSGTSSNTTADDFYFEAPTPSVTGLSPAHGVAGGGTRVVVTGSNFTGVKSVRFGNLYAASYVVNSLNQITAYSPGGSPGSKVDVVVSTSYGTTNNTALDDFTYDVPPPSLTWLGPNHGPSTGGASVTISGSNLLGSTEVKFGTVPAASFRIFSAYQINAVAPAGVPGQKVDVSVTTAGGTTVNTGADDFTFDYPVPSILGVSPGRGEAAGGTPVTIAGLGFDGAQSVWFGSTPAASFTLISPTQILAFAPAGVVGTKVNIRVATPGGTTANVTGDDYTYIAPDREAPKVVITAPKAGNVAASFDVTGTMLDASGVGRVEVSLNGAPAQLAFLGDSSGGSLTFSLPGLSAENGKNIVSVRATDTKGNQSLPVAVTVNYVNNRPEFNGLYYGLIVPDSLVVPSNALSGLLTMKVSSSGIFTGKILLGGFSIPIKGIFGNDRIARFMPGLANSLSLVGQASVPVGLGILSLSIEERDAVAVISGTLRSSEETLVARIEAEQVYFDGKTKFVDGDFLKNNGAYTVVLASKPQRGDLQAAAYPQGDGYGSITVKANGIASIRGKLADGETLSAAAPLTSSYQWPLFSKLYGKAGSIAGKVTLTNSNSISQIAGADLIWFRPSLANAPYYPDGWRTGINVDLAGSEYASPQKTPGAGIWAGLVPVDALTGNAALTFTDEAGFNLLKRVNIDPASGKVSNLGESAALDKSFKLVLTPAGGLFRGTFLDGNGKNTAFKGIILQHAIEIGGTSLEAGGYGFFLSPPTSEGSGRSGRVLLQPDVVTP